MAKLDLTNVPRELDELIAGSDNPRHRQIAEVVRRHYLLELLGRTAELFDADMMVADPLYYMNIDGMSLTLRGREQVAAFYESQQGVVLAATELTHAVTDAGYWAECWFNFYLTGAELAAQGVTVDDPAGAYLKRCWISMVWPFDADARMLGERGYEHADVREIVPIAAADVITADEARETLTPLLRPLPVYAG